MSGTNHHANFNREFERRFKKYNGKYDIGDFAYELYREKLLMKKKFDDYLREQRKINYGM